MYPCRFWFVFTFIKFDISTSQLPVQYRYEIRMYSSQYHDDVIKWKRFPRYWPFVRGIHPSPVDSPHKGRWRGVLMFSLMCAWTNVRENSPDAGDLRRHDAHCDVTVMTVPSDAPSPSSAWAPVGTMMTTLFKHICLKDLLAVNISNTSSRITWHYSKWRKRYHEIWQQFQGDFFMMIYFHKPWPLILCSHSPHITKRDIQKLITTRDLSLAKAAIITQLCGRPSLFWPR